MSNSIFGRREASSELYSVFVVSSSLTTVHAFVIKLLICVLAHNFLLLHVIVCVFRCVWTLKCFCMSRIGVHSQSIL